MCVYIHHDIINSSHFLIILCLYGIRAGSKNQNLFIFLHIYFTRPMTDESNQVIIPNFLEPTKALVIININNIVKLTSTNYLSWTLQVESLLIGYDLNKFIDGSNPPPPPTIMTNDVKSPNLEFQLWLHPDKLIFGALVRSLTPSLNHARQRVHEISLPISMPNYLERILSKSKNKSNTQQKALRLSKYMQVIKARADE